MTTVDQRSTSRTASLLGTLVHAEAARDANPVVRPRSRGLVEAWVFLFIAVPLVAVAALAIRRSADVERAEIVDRLRAVAQVKAAFVARWVDTRHQDGRNLMREFTLAAAMSAWMRDPDGPLRQDMHDRLRTMIAAGPYTDAIVVGLDGAASVAASGDERRVAAEPELRRAMAGVRESGSVRDTGLYRSGAPGDEGVHFDVVVPMATAGAPRAVLVLRYDPRRMMIPLSNEWPGAANGARCRLVQRESEGLRFFDGEEASASMVLASEAIDGRPLAIAAALRGGVEIGAATEGVSPGGIPVTTVAIPVEGTPLFVAAEMPQEAVDSLVSADAAWIVLVDVLALVAAAIGVVVVLQRRSLALAGLREEQREEKMRALRLLDDIANGSTDAIYARDARGCFVFVNKEVCRALGKPAHEIVGRTMHELFPKADADEIRRIDSIVMAQGRTVDAEVDITTAHGTRTHAYVNVPLRDGQGRAIGVCGISRDVTDRKRDEKQRRQWAMAFESTRDGVMITDTAGRIVAVNRSFTQITGYAQDAVVGQTPKILRSGRHDADFYEGMWRTLRTSGHWQGEIWNRRCNGEVYPELLSISGVRDESEAVVSYVGVFTDLSRLRQDEAQLDQLAHYDPLTNLPNRRLMQHGLEYSLARATRHGGRIVAMSIDLDGFHTVNDSLGHPAGDELLVSVAKRLAMRMQSCDKLGRLGGDEFLVVLEDVADSADVATLARELLAAIAEPIPLLAGREAYVTASIGISMYPADGSVTAVEMLRDADAAMYRAKDLGRNGFCFYTADLNVEATARLDLEVALSRALSRDELLLHYQPKVDGRTGAIVGLEALLRWQRDGRLVPPGQFIPIAERSSLILDIGAWVIDRACAQVREWLDAGLDVPRVAVNVASRQVASGDLDRVVAAALARHRVAPSCLEVEITEGVLMEQPEATAQLLERVRALGVTLALDDFGTGYSSLGYLQRFPIDTLKIDQSFVRTIGAEPDGAAIADAVIALAHRLRLRVVAEGVETAAQRDHLAAQGCDEMQGYHFDRPLAPDVAALRLAAARELATAA